MTTLPANFDADLDRGMLNLVRLLDRIPTCAAEGCTFTIERDILKAVRTDTRDTLREGFSVLSDAQVDKLALLLVKANEALALIDFHTL